MAYFRCGLKALFYKAFRKLFFHILYTISPLSLRAFEESAAIPFFLRCHSHFLLYHSHSSSDVIPIFSFIIPILPQMSFPFPFSVIPAQAGIYLFLSLRDLIYQGAAISSFLFFSKNLQLVPCNSHLMKNFSSKKAGLLRLKNHGGHSSFIFPQLMHG